VYAPADSQRASKAYHGTHGKYPVSLAEISSAEVNGPIYYDRDLDSASVYYLWFGTGFGTVSQYDSKTRTWHGPHRSNQSLEPTALWRCAFASILITLLSTGAQPRCQSGGSAQSR
jgi:hypothetical protein